jgi:hypothetical protein
LQAQKYKSSQTKRHRTLRAQDAFAWITFFGLSLLMLVLTELEQWVTKQRASIQPISLLFLSGLFATSIHNFRKVRRGELVRDFFGYPKNASLIWVFLGGMGILACFVFAMMLLIFPPPHPSVWSYLIKCSIIGMFLTFAGLLGKWSYREYRRWRFGDFVEMFESQNEKSKKSTDGAQTLGMGIGGLLLLFIGILGLMVPGNHLLAILLSVLGGLFFFSSVSAWLSQNSSNRPNDKIDSSEPIDSHDGR